MSQLYRWNSELFRDYHPGFVIVVASSIDEARSIVRGKFLEYCQAGGFPGPLSFEEVLAIFEKDLEAEPVVGDYGFIFGGG